MIETTEKHAEKMSLTASDGLFDLKEVERRLSIVQRRAEKGQDAVAWHIADSDECSSLTRASYAISEALALCEEMASAASIQNNRTEHLMAECVDYRAKIEQLEKALKDCGVSFSWAPQLTIGSGSAE